MAPGARRLARIAGMADTTPNVRASYDADSTTPRFPAPATTTGLPARLGSFCVCTDA